MTTCLSASLFKMGLSGCCLPVLLVLVFRTVVYSASVKGQDEEFISFLTDALNMTTPPESPAPEIFPDISNPFRHPDPAAVCTTPGPVDNSAETGSRYPEPGSVELSDTADEKSKENSDSADHTDYDYRSSKKRNRLPEALKPLPDNSADSNSAERTNMGTHVNTAAEKRPSKTRGPVPEDRSSQEMVEPQYFETYEEWKWMDTAKGSGGHGLSGSKQTKTTEGYLPDQPQNKERVRRNKRGLTVYRDSAKAAVKQASDSTTLTDRQSSIDLDLDCMELSRRAMRFQNGENTSAGGPDIDPQRKEGISDYESQLRKMCAGRKRLRAPTISREQLDRDSVERVNSELLDRDNSNEGIDKGMPALTL